MHEQLRFVRIGQEERRRENISEPSFTVQSLPNLSQDWKWDTHKGVVDLLDT